MKLKEYMQKLNELIKNNQEALEFTVITSIDDEGNDFKVVNFDPSIGFYESGEFDSDEETSDDDFNAVCLN